MPPDPSDRLAESKHEGRLEIMHRRALRRRSHRLAADQLRTPRVMAEIPPGAAVSCYASFGEEPDTTELLDELFSHQHRVLLPMVTPGRMNPQWAWCTSLDQLVPGRWGIPEPTTPKVSGDAIAEVDVVICPALAVATDGSRLGTGGGWYDRVLPSRRPGVPIWALCNDDEVFGHLPTDPHDVGVDRIFTPTRTIHTTTMTATA